YFRRPHHRWAEQVAWLAGLDVRCRRFFLPERLSGLPKPATPRRTAPLPGGQACPTVARSRDGGRRHGDWRGLCDDRSPTRLSRRRHFTLHVRQPHLLEGLLYAHRRELRRGGLQRQRVPVDSSVGGSVLFGARYPGIRRSLI